MKDELTAIATQHKLTYGDNLSPILANFQNMPRNLCLDTNQPQFSTAVIYSSARIVLHAYPCSFGNPGWPEGKSVPFLVPVHRPGKCSVYVCGRADEEKDDEEEGVKVKKSGLLKVCISREQYRMIILVSLQEMSIPF